MKLTYKEAVEIMEGQIENIKEQTDNMPMTREERDVMDLLLEANRMAVEAMKKIEDGE